MRLFARYLAAAAVLAACDASWVASTPLGDWVSFSAQVKYEHLDEVDVLFAIDDSPSMADKREALKPPLAAFVERLIAPRCVQRDGTTCSTDVDCASLGPGAACVARGVGFCEVPSHAGDCPSNLEPEFPPVRDLHVGVVRSSLGPGHLFGGTLATTAPLSGAGGGFLAWLPRTVPENQAKPAPNVTAYEDDDDGRFVADFATLLDEVGASGDHVESQLESWYRFLAQPDPYASLGTNEQLPPRTELVGVDAELLAERHDFLRPSSLLVIVQVTDEDDASIDPLAEGGHAWFASAPTFPGGPGPGLGPRGTIACDADPTSPACSSCAFPENAADPSCVSCAGGLASCPQKGWYAPGQDSLDARFTDDMRRRYGFEPQYDVQRYVDAFRKPRVPDRAGDACTNPIFARELPDGSDTSSGALCTLPLGPRTPDLVTYVAIVGAAPSLLRDSAGNLALEHTGAEWDKMIGSARDPHMIESIGPRKGLPAPGTTYALGSDPDEGREWNASALGIGDDGSSVDLQFACTMPLAAPRDCTTTSSCPCSGSTAPDGPPLCDPAAPTMQTRAPAWPGIRELRVAQGLGQQSSVGSICAPFADAFRLVYDRFVFTGTGQCLAPVIRPRTDCSVQCVVLLVYPDETDQSAGCTDPGTSQPDATTLHAFAAEYLASLGDAAPVAVPVVCAYRQLVGGAASSVAQATGCTNADPDYAGASCASSAQAGWCYVDGAVAANGCPEGIDFGAGGPPAGTTIDFECLQRE